MQPIEAALAAHEGLSREVLDYAVVMKRLVDAAKQPGFDPARWDEMAAFLDTTRFLRIGNFKEEMDWPSYRAFLVGWAPGAHWECSFKRVTERGRTVFLELEERTGVAGGEGGEPAPLTAVNSLSVYGFDEAGRIVDLDIYLQMPLPDPAMLAAYADVDMAG